jgi:hypothetical protein
MFSRELKALCRALLIACLSVLFLSTTSATAANQGDPFLLGKSNSIALTTGLTGSTAGPQLSVSNTSSSGFGVYGSSPNTGLYGYSGPGTGVLGQHVGASGAAPGVRGLTTSASSNAAGVLGESSQVSPGAGSAGVRGISESTTGYGVGVWGSQEGTGAGVYGSTLNGGTGVYGLSPSGVGASGISASGTGVFAQHTSSSGTPPAVFAQTNSASTQAVGVLGKVSPTSPGSSSAGIRGINNGTGGSGIGVWGSQAGFGFGVYGFAPSGRGVYGVSTTGTGVLGSGGDYGVYGASPLGFGVYGTGQNIGVKGFSSAGTALIAQTVTGDAGSFFGNVIINGGTCTGCTGPSALQIDDPLDPAHKYLQHSSVASSQQLDIYSGNATTNSKGFATVTMPRWFQALNRSFRYQLTVVGKAHWDAKAAVWNEIKDNRFTIRTDEPQVKVSWLVTGIRHDRYANAHPVQVVALKAKADQGKFLYPEVYGQPRTEGIGYQKPLRVPRKPALKR